MGIIVLTTARILFLIDKFLKVEFLNATVEYIEIILYFGLANWALGIMQKYYLQRKELNHRRTLAQR